jgi:hypothetical protein
VTASDDPVGAQKWASLPRTQRYGGLTLSYAGRCGLRFRASLQLSRLALCDRLSRKQWLCRKQTIRLMLRLLH